MSIKIDLNKIDTEKTGLDLTIELESSKYAFSKNPEYLYPYVLNDKDIDIPFGYAMTNNYDFRPLRSYLPQINIKFIGELREQQKEVKNQAIKFLNTTGCVMISSPPGFGKTCMAINICSFIKLRSMIITKGTVLLKQWQDSIYDFCPDAKCQIIETKTKIKENMDFYIVNAINIPKFDKLFLKTMGCVVIDEAHQVMSKILHQSLYHLFPRYLIGLTATPYRPDSLDALLKLYFGENVIFKKLYREHIVYKMYTPYTPPIIKNIRGETDWNSVLEFQSTHVQRNEDIIELVRYMKDRIFLIICKRVDQANYLFNRLKELNEDVTSLIGSQVDFERNSRILVGIIQKVGVGFNHPKLNTLILASDALEYYVQYIARTMRTQHGTPIIFDFIDDNKSLISHGRERTNVYIDHGGKICNFHADYQDCKIFESYKQPKIYKTKNKQVTNGIQDENIRILKS